MNSRPAIFHRPGTKILTGLSIGTLVGGVAAVVLGTTVPASIPFLPYIIGGPAVLGGLGGGVQSYVQGRNIRRAYELVSVDDAAPEAFQQVETGIDPEDYGDTDLEIQRENAERAAQAKVAAAAGSGEAQIQPGGSTGQALTAMGVDGSEPQQNPFALADSGKDDEVVFEDEAGRAPAVGANAAVASAVQGVAGLRVDVVEAERTRNDSVVFKIEEADDEDAPDVLEGAAAVASQLTSLGLTRGSP